MPDVRRAVAVSAVLVLFGCSGSSSPGSPGPPSTTLHAEVTDPAGDAVALAGAGSPDLVRASVDVAGGSITFAIQLAPGTLDRQFTRLTIELDTDLNPATGIRTATGLGIDYALDLWTARPAQAVVQRASPATCASGGVCFGDVATAPLTIGADAMTTTVPLASLGDAGGRLQFRVTVYVSPQVPPTVVADQMPNAELAPAHVP